MFSRRRIVCVPVCVNIDCVADFFRETRFHQAGFQDHTAIGNRYLGSWDLSLLRVRFLCFQLCADSPGITPALAGAIPMRHSKNPQKRPKAIGAGDRRFCGFSVILTVQTCPFPFNGLNTLSASHSRSWIFHIIPYLRITLHGASCLHAFI